ncbi:MAG: 50S ribosomal protein L25 [Chloroflexota bacterium]
MKLTAASRDLIGKKSRRLLREGRVPAVVYGHHVDARPISLDAREFGHVFHRVGQTHLIDLEVDGGRAEKVLVKAVQTHPRRHGPIHVDLHQVSLKEKLQVEVPVVVTGESPAVKQGDADVAINVHRVRVECLPTDIPEGYTVDISGLENIGDAIRVSDLPAIENVVVIDDPEEVIVRITPRRELMVEEEVAPAEGAAAPAAEGEAAEGDEAQAAGGASEEER